MKREALKKEWAYRLINARNQDEAAYENAKDEMTDDLTQDECQEVFNMIDEK